MKEVIDTHDNLQKLQKNSLYKNKLKINKNIPTGRFTGLESEIHVYMQQNVVAIREYMLSKAILERMKVIGGGGINGGGEGGGV